MKIKYYGVPHNATTLKGFLSSRGINISEARSERLIRLYKWILAEPRQWQRVGIVSFRIDAPKFYRGLKDSTFNDDVRLLAKVRLIFPMFADPSLLEIASKLI